MKNCFENVRQHEARDENEQFGIAEDYTRALQVIMAEGIQIGTPSVLGGFVR